MSELKIKSDQNFFSGETLIGREFRCYATSIHCFYYSCLQYMAYVIISNKLITGTLKEAQNFYRKGSHEIIRDLFEGKYIDDADIDDYNNYREYIGQLEQNRIESDYWETKIDESKSKQSKDLANRVLQNFKKKYK